MQPCKPFVITYLIMKKTTKHSLSCAAVMLALSCGQLHARPAEGMGGAYAACRASADMHMTAASDNTRVAFVLRMLLIRSLGQAEGSGRILPW